MRISLLQIKGDFFYFGPPWELGVIDGVQRMRRSRGARSLQRSRQGQTVILKGHGTLAWQLWRGEFQSKNSSETLIMETSRWSPKKQCCSCQVCRTDVGYNVLWGNEAWVYLSSEITEKIEAWFWLEREGASVMVWGWFAASGPGLCATV